jgi:O-antigen ligase
MPSVLERRAALRPAGLATAGIGISILVALAVGNPTSGSLIVPLAVGGFATFVFVALRPFTGFLILVASSMLMIVIQVSGSRGLNAFDVVLPIVFVVTVLGRTRTLAIQADRDVLNDDASASAKASLRVQRVTLLFFGYALVSTLPWILGGHAAHAMDSLLVLVRGFQGLSLFPLCLWWLRSEERLSRTTRSVIVGGLALAAVNGLALLSWGVHRAGVTWVLNAEGNPISGPNEAAMVTLLFGAVTLARHSVRPQARNILFLAIAATVLVFTQSRSGLLAWVVFLLMSIRRDRLKGWIVGAAFLALLLPFVPGIYWRRIARTAVLERGSFEAFSSLIRVFGWKVAWSVFLDHPVFGVGYLGFRFVSDNYNDFRVVLITVENYFLEIAVSLGLVGLAMLGVLIVRIYQLGRTAERVTAPGTLGHAMATYHFAFFTALLVSNLTGDNFVGLTGLACIALWTGTLVQAGRLATREPSP